MKRLILILLPALVLIGPMAQAADTFIRTEIGTAVTLERCEEDMPCWDCATMGNLVCGVPR